MPNYSALIDPTDFGLVTDYLRDPASDIDYLLHVKSADSLAPLAEALDREVHLMDIAAGRFPDAIKRGLAEGSILIDLPDPRQWIDPGSVPRQASCQVLYRPPFYLVHIPGLFEANLVRREVRQKAQIELRPTLKARLKS